MKCPKCGTTNGKTNRFCRGCGLKLEGLPEHETQRPQSECAPDEVALGEELFGVWQDYSAGSLDTALARAEKVISCNPASASAHSILALIYERKAERALGAGDIETGHGMLKLAIAQYERIIELNPDSAADREKLASLRKLLEGQPQPRVKRTLGFRDALSAVPRPVLAGVATMLVLLIVGIVFLLPAGKRDEMSGAVGPRQEGAQAGDASVVVSPGATQTSPGSASPGGSDGLRVYTFPAPSPRSSAGGLSVPRPPAPAVSGARSRVEPLRLPPLSGAQVSVVPESKGGAGAAKKPETPGKGSNTGGSDSGSITITPSKGSEDAASQAPDGSGTLARAIELHNQGKVSEAIAAARQAIGLFQVEVEANRNPSAAKRGAENARKLIQLWQQTTTSE